MTRLTKLIIENDPAVYAAAYPEGKKFGLYVGTIERTPSGCQRARDLLTSAPVYNTAEEAAEAGNKVIAECRAGCSEAEAGL